jgi:hypothetical protein
MNTLPASKKRHRFPPQIAHAVWIEKGGFETALFLILPSTASVAAAI